ncbi:diguanylate cyclase [Sulfurimonas sp.]|uniref:diguanylate cyclase n=1 Tax=Sulfurimonas sp. TaxID=2022749 RepID=UPI00260DDD4D|nr:diguanylate cyclase [Sulfurimonas sp.]
MLSELNVLYVEDDVEIAEEVLFLLEKKLHHVDMTYDGQEGLQKYKAQKPDIIITDIQMPKLSGLDMIAAIKEDDESVPIIITSAFNETDKLLRAIELKVDAYLTKPIDMHELLHKIDKLTRSKFLEQEVNELQYIRAKQSALKYQKLLELSAKMSEMLFWEFDAETTSFAFNDLSYHFLGTSIEKEKSYTMPFMHYVNTFVAAQDRQTVINVLNEALHQSMDYVTTFEYRLEKANGKVIEVSCTAYITYNKARKLDKAYGTVLNIEKIRAKQRETERSLALIDQYISYYSMDLDGNITTLSSAFSELIGYDKKELIGKNQSILMDKKIQESFYEDLWKTVSEDKVFIAEVKSRKKDTSLLWLQLKILPLYDDNNVKNGYMVIEQDITNKKIIEELSITDSLTKLYNRRYFISIFPKELSRAKRENITIAFVMLDVDNFKLYNDTYGHPAGDVALSKIATVLKEFANRGSDTAFRMGGEEFSLILQFEHKEQLQQHLQRLIESVENLRIPHANNKASKYITISAGVVCILKDNRLSHEELYKVADELLYKAKSNGRNQYILTCSQTC